MKYHMYHEFEPHGSIRKTQGHHFFRIAQQGSKQLLLLYQ